MEYKNVSLLVESGCHLLILSEMGGKVMIAETTGNNYGVSIRGTIEGTALSFSEEFRRVSPQVTGLYYLESEVGVCFIILPSYYPPFATEKPGSYNEDHGSSDEVGRLWETETWPCYEVLFCEFYHFVKFVFRITERPDGVCVEERFAGQNKTYSCKFDEEYDYSAPGRYK